MEVTTVMTYMSQGCYGTAKDSVGMMTECNMTMYLMRMHTAGFCYRLGMVNSNMVNSKFHLIRSFCEIFARFLSFHV